jgi:hypothetical protein
VEHRASDYQGFKDAHARSGAGLSAAMLRSAGVDEVTAQSVARLIEGHERPQSSLTDRETVMLADADSLSFFALNSPGFADYFGRQHSLRKIAYTLGRMSPRARALLGSIKLRADVRELLSCVEVSEIPGQASAARST